MTFKVYKYKQRLLLVHFKTMQICNAQFICYEMEAMQIGFSF